MSKGENAGYQHSVLFPQYFEKFSLSGLFNSLPNDEIVEQFKLKAFADDKLKAAKMIIFVFDRVENIMGKEENPGYQHFLLFP